MTLICAHRCNTLTDLAAVSKAYGVEIDVRSYGGKLVVDHEPFVAAVSLEDWLAEYAHKFLIVNIKEEGLEEVIQKQLDFFGVKDWAFLDQSFPFLVKFLRLGQTRTMVRISEYENISTAVGLFLRPDWVWLDSFLGQWYCAQDLERISEFGYRIMVVSPELQARSLEAEIEGIVATFVEAKVPIAGVCTKKPQLWAKYV